MQDSSAVIHFANASLRACRPYLPVLLATIIVASLCLFGEPLYQENDDPLLAMVSAGFGVAVTPEPHLIWSHLGYGLLLGALSRLIGLNAHGWVTVFAIWLSLTLLIRVSLQARSPKIRWCVLLVCLGCIFLAALLAAQFTITAAVLFGAAFANFLASAEERQPIRSLWTAANILAFVLSYLIRPESYMMGLVIVLPALLFLCWYRSEINRRARILAVCLPLVVAAGSIQTIAYSTSPEWRYVPEYIDLLNDLNDFHRVPWLPQAPEYRQVGWTSNDYAMFDAWYAQNPIYNIDNLRFLVKRLAIPQIATAPNQIWAWFSFPFTSWRLVLPLLAQVAVCILLGKQRRRVALLLILGEWAAIATASTTGRDPLDYVWYAAAAITLMSLCALLVTALPQKGSLFQNLGLTLAGSLGLLATVGFCSDHMRVCQQAARYRNWISQNSNYFKGKVVVWAGGLTWEWLITPTRIYPPFTDLKVASIDDVNGMPVETAMLNQLGIADLAKELGTNPELRLFSQEYLIPLLTVFCQQHYGIHPTFKEAASWDGNGIYLLDHSP